MEEEVKIEETIPVEAKIEESFDLFAELNTVLSEKDKFSEKHIRTKTEEVYAKLRENTGIEFPEIDTLKATIGEKEKSIGELTSKLSEIDKLKEDISAKDKILEETKSELEKFKSGRNGKLYGEKQITDVVTEDKFSIYKGLLKTSPIEATKYYNKEILNK